MIKVKQQNVQETARNLIDFDGMVPNDDDWQLLYEAICWRSQLLGVLHFTVWENVKCTSPLRLADHTPIMIQGRICFLCAWGLISYRRNVHMWYSFMSDTRKHLISCSFELSTTAKAIQQEAKQTLIYPVKVRRPTFKPIWKLTVRCQDNPIYHRAKAVNFGPHWLESVW
jgi:hypothetical protein